MSENQNTQEPVLDTPIQVQRISQDVLQESVVGGNLNFEEKAKEQILEFGAADQKQREKLIDRLSIISILWLIFTACIIGLQGSPLCFGLTDTVMITFLTTSLGTVLGLWSIGLTYYFFLRK